jgi:para-nitrobenzyl esterase
MTDVTPPRQIVVMGVSAAGKTRVGQGIATGLGIPFIDADDLHPAANVAKMTAGTALTDDDRWPWLDLVGDALAASPDGTVVGCSALRRVYRDRIRARAPETIFVHLTGSPQLLAERAAARLNHFMPPSLLASQLALLEPLEADETGFAIDVTPSVDEIVAAALRSLTSAASSAATTPALTDIDSGTLFGYTERGVHTFRGIPYAKAERFARAQPVKRWDGVRPAMLWGANCPISANDSVGRLEFANFSASNLPQNEDCLFVNVWTTSLDAYAALPVIFFIHGGQYTTGSSNQLAYYEGRNLAAKGEAIFVSVNHRLNVLGYLDLSEFGEEYADTGNLGQFDLIDALKWVRTNAAAFGGDKDNVTLVGQSGGGGKVLTLMGMPEAQGLFHRAWVSSAATGWRDVEGAQAQTRAVLEQAGVETPAELAALPYLEILEAGNRAGFAAGPVTGSKAFPEPSFTSDSGFTDRAANIPLVVTTNLGEFHSNLMRMTAFIADPADPFADNYIPGITAERVHELMLERFGEHASAIADAFAAAYPHHPLADVLFMEDGSFFGGPRDEILAAKTARPGAAAYGGVVAKNLPVFGGVTAAHTSGDVPFLFANAEMMTRLTAGDESGFARYSEQLSGALLAFAKSGDPSTPSLAWPVFTPVTETMMVFDTVTAPHDHHEKELYRLFAAAKR